MAIRPLTDALAEIARVELNEDPTRLQESMYILKEWIRKQPHLKARTDEQWLVAFLRGCKFSLERVKAKIDLYYSLRSAAPDLFSIKHTDSKVSDILDKGIGLILPKTASPTAPRVILFRATSYDPDKYKALELMSVGTIQLQISYLEDDNFTVSGIIVVFDLKDVKLDHFAQFTPLILKKLIALNQDAAPMRVKGLHFINSPPIFESFFDMAKKFLNEKNRKRLHVHIKNYEDFYKHVPENILPIEYGGTEYHIQDVIDYWKGKYRQYHEWLEEDLTFGTDESKRPGESKAADMFGVEGSFRRLEFD